MLAKLLTITFFFFNFISLQKAMAADSVNVELRFLDTSLDVSKFKIFYNDSKNFKSITPSANNGTYLFKEKIVSRLASLFIFWIKPDGEVFGQQFLIDRNSSKIIFKKVKPFENPFQDYGLTGVAVLEKTKNYKNFQRYLKVENENLKKYSELNKKLKSDSLQKIINDLEVKKNLRSLKYFEGIQPSYLDFWIFSNNIVASLMPDHQPEVYEVFTKTFQEKYGDSIEGIDLRNLIVGSSKEITGKAATDFEIVDINSNRLNLEFFRGRYLLISFWATWCKPCLAEIPYLKEIRKLYGDDKLNVLSVSIDEDSVAFRKAIQQFDMNWYHVIGDNILRSNFGQKPIPSLYLIGNKGIILYSSWEQPIDTLTTILKRDLL